MPVAHVKPSRRPESCDQSSGPVVSMWARRLAVLSNWLVQTAFLVDSGGGGGWLVRKGCLGRGGEGVPA